MIFIENISFACNNIKSIMRVTSGDVYLTDWMDLDTFIAVPPRETARVFGLQGAPTDPNTGAVRASTQRI